MSRVYLNVPLKTGEEISLSGNEHHYLSNVLRLRAEDPVFLFNGSSKEYVARIWDQTSQKTILRIESEKEVLKESLFKISIAQAIPKGQKLDDLLPRLTELGVTEVIPLITERTIPKKISPHKVERWKKIVIQSAEQCGRTVVPKIHSPLTWKGFYSLVQNTPKILFYELEESQTLETLLKHLTTSQVCFIIGPEGGFTPGEVGEAKHQGCQMASLGKRILRTETVAPAVCAIAQFVKGDLNTV